MHHLLHQPPRFSVLLHQHMRSVSPVQVPVFQAMDLAVFVHLCAQLVAVSAPAELPTPIPFNLVGECMRFYVIKAERVKLSVFQVFLPLLPLAVDQLLTTLFFLYCSNVVPF